VGASGQNISVNEEDEMYTVVIPPTNNSFSLPYEGLNAGTHFEIISLEPNRWKWGYEASYMGRITPVDGVGEMKGIPVPDGLSSGDYYFEAKIGYYDRDLMCFSEPIPFKVHVAKIGESDAIIICSGNRVNYTPKCVQQGGAPENYKWVRRAVEGIEEGESSGVGGFSEVLTNTTDHNITVRYSYTSNKYGCDGIENFDVVVLVKPWVHFEIVNNSTEICSGDVTNIQIFPSDWDYKWRIEQNGVNGAEESAGGSVINQRINYESTPGKLVYRISPITDFCFEEQSTVVMVRELPEIELDLSKLETSVSFGYPIVMDAYPEIYSNYKFKLNDKTKEQSSNEVEWYDWHLSSSNTASVSIVDENGCENIDEKTFTGPEVKLPNVFNPASGSNDLFYNAYELEVFDVNGGRIYKGKNGWDGKYNGTLVPTGTYLYIVKTIAPDGTNVVRRYHVYVNTGE
jgi:hypothetical protein